MIVEREHLTGVALDLMNHAQGLEAILLSVVTLLQNSIPKNLEETIETIVTEVLVIIFKENEAAIGLARKIQGSKGGNKELII